MLISEGSDKTPRQFFLEMLTETEKQFIESPVYSRQVREGKQWGYSVCATPILKNEGVLFGINWGGSDNFQPQSSMPMGETIKQDYFIKRNQAYLESKWNLNFEKINFNYSNLCFFRTPKEKDLTLKDYELSIQLFEKYIRYINPPWLLSIGGTSIQVLNKFNALRNLTTHYDSKRKFKGYSGYLWDWNIFSVPHPSAHLTSEARQCIWDLVTAEMEKAHNL